jgi:hypothetical protein
LVRANRGGEGPFVEVGARGHVVEAAVPHDGAYLIVSMIPLLGASKGLPADAALMSALRIEIFPNILNRNDRDQLHEESEYQLRSEGMGE